MADPSTLRATKVLFLAGLGRSGSTLIERVIGQTPGVAALGEVVHLWQRGLIENERCGCGAAFMQCPFWEDVGRRAFGGWDQIDVDRVLRLKHQVDRTRFVPLLACRRMPRARRVVLLEYVSYYERLYAAAKEVAGVECLIDSSKHTSLAYCLRRANLDLRVLHCVRDSRGVAYSWTKEVQRPEAAAGNLMTQYSPGKSALLWDAHNMALEGLAVLGSSVLRLRYEDFLRSPELSAGRVLGFLDVPGRPAGLDNDGVQLSSSHTVAGNPVRFATGHVAFRQDIAWRTALPPRQRRVVVAMTAPLLMGYGYVSRVKPEVASLGVV